VIVRLRRLPALPVMAGGAVTGFVGGLVVGCVLGALLTWFSGAVLDWHRQLGFTLGVTEELLPLGEQIGLLQAVRDLWWVVVPAVGLALGGLNALVGLLAGAVLAGLFNRLGHGIWLDVEVAPAPAHGVAPEEEPAAAVAQAVEAPPARARRSPRRAAPRPSSPPPP
jgi:hypothetical protein